VLVIGAKFATKISIKKVLITLPQKLLAIDFCPNVSTDFIMFVLLSGIWGRSTIAKMMCMSVVLSARRPMVKLQKAPEKKI